MSLLINNVGHRTGWAPFREPPGSHKEHKEPSRLPAEQQSTEQERNRKLRKLRSQLSSSSMTKYRVLGPGLGTITLRPVPALLDSQASVRLRKVRGHHRKARTTGLIDTLRNATLHALKRDAKVHQTEEERAQRLRIHLALPAPAPILHNVIVPIAAGPRVVHALPAPAPIDVHALPAPVPIDNHARVLPAAGPRLGNAPARWGGGGGACSHSQHPPP